MTGLNWACNGIGNYEEEKPEAYELKVSMNGLIILNAPFFKKRPCIRAS